jgi:hypothetical protein
VLQALAVFTAATLLWLVVHLMICSMCPELPVMSILSYRQGAPATPQFQLRRLLRCCRKNMPAIVYFV